MTSEEVTIGTDTITGEISEETFSINVSSEPDSATITVTADGTPITPESGSYFIPYDTTSLVVTGSADGYTTTTKTYSVDVTRPTPPGAKFDLTIKKAASGSKWYLNGDDPFYTGAHPNDYNDELQSGDSLTISFPGYDPSNGYEVEVVYHNQTNGYAIYSQGSWSIAKNAQGDPFTVSDFTEATEGYSALKMLIDVMDDNGNSVATFEGYIINHYGE